MKPARQSIDGVLLLNKPVGITSNAALQKAKWLLNAKKAGHTGTLDPFADGLLPLCFGEATKFSAYLLEADKHYRAVVQLGVTTMIREGLHIRDLELCDAFRGHREVQILPLSGLQSGDTDHLSGHVHDRRT